MNPTTRPTLGAGPIVGLAASVLLLLTGARKWIDGDPGITGYNVPAKFLVDVEVRQEGASIGSLFIVLAVAAAIGVLAPRLRLLTVIAGVAVLVIVLLFVYQLGEYADLVNEDAFGIGNEIGVGDLIGIGVWMGAVAGIALIVAGVLSGRTRAAQ